MGIVSIARSEVRPFNRPLDEMTAHENEIAKLSIALAPEGSRTSVQMTVRENLETGASVCEDGKALAMDFEGVYDLIPRLKEREKQAARTLCGGERQMLKARIFS
jgi:branched-chain amino acid transport system ATP-binding protein